jgi:pimeloyl-ACP methyl ester carboxylesterase
MLDAARERPPVSHHAGRNNLLPAAVAAGLLAALWYDTRRRRQQAEHDLPPHGRFVEVGGTRLHYVAAGEHGQVVVLIHGAMLMLQDFVASPVFTLATERYRVIAIDRPGYGYSGRPGRMGSPMAQARLLRAGLRRLGIDRPVLVGHSYGGPVALAYAQQFPDEVAGVVFLGGGVAYPMPRLDLAPMMLPAIPILGAALRNTVLQPAYRLLLPLLIRLCFAPQPVPDSFAKAVPTDMLLRPQQLRALGEDFQALVPALAALSRHYPEIDLPVAIVAGEADKIAYPRFHASRLAEALPNARLSLAPGIGHMIHHFRPGLVLDAIADVVERSRRAASRAA